MDHPPRSITSTVLSKRSFESDTWLILGITVAIFAFLSSIGVFILCYRRRGHKRRIDRKRMVAGKTRGEYVKLDEEKGDTQGEREEEVPLQQRRTVESYRGTPLPPAGRNAATVPVEANENLYTTYRPDRRRDPSPQPQQQPHLHLPPQSHPQPQTHLEPQLQYTSVNLQHPQPQGVYLPPDISNERGRRQSLRPEYDHDHDHNDDYDGRTGHRYERSRSPSPERLVLSRSISMLRPREQL